MSTIFDRFARAGFWAGLGLTLTQAQLTEFQGGNLHLEAEGNWSPFALTSSSGARGAMAEITTLYPSASSQFGNPAALAHLQGMSVQTDLFLPGMGLGVSSERIQLLRNNLRQPIQEMLDDPRHRVSDPTYPDVSLGLYQSSGLSGFSIAHGRPGMALALGVQQPFSGRLKAFAGGMRFGLGMPDSAGDSLKFSAAGDAFAHLAASLSDFSIGVAAHPWKRLRLGFSVHRYALNLRFDAEADFQGSMRLGSRQAAFNDTNAAYSNALGATGYGRLEGQGHGFRLGAAWEWGRFGADALLSFAETLRLKGDIRTENNLPPALQMDEDTLLDASRHLASKLALTQRNAERLSDFTVVLPWEAGLSLRFQSRNWRVNLDYLTYLRGLSLSFVSRDSATVYDGNTRDIRRNADGEDSVLVGVHRDSYRLSLQQHFGLGLEYKQVFLHAGALFYAVSRASLVEESAAFQPDFLPFLPTLNLGYHFPLGPRLNTTVSLVAFPVSLFKTTVEYRY